MNDEEKRGVRLEIRCNVCINLYAFIESTTALDFWVEDHLRTNPGHTFCVRNVGESEPTVNTDLNNLVRQQQKWIDSSRARIIALEEFVDLLLSTGLARGEYTANQIRDIKYGRVGGQTRNFTVHLDGRDIRPKPE